MATRFVPFCLLTALVLTVSAGADDWPQWRGPQRTGVSKETGLLKEWPKAGPKLLWEQKDIGGGYSTPAIVGDRMYLMGDRKGEEFVLALAVKDGSEIWATPIGKNGPNTPMASYPGSRSTPTVDGDRIYALGSDGDLACLDKDKGKVIWTKNLRKEYNGTPGQWAYAESVLIDGDMLVCTPGGKTPYQLIRFDLVGPCGISFSIPSAPATTMAAMKKKDGKTVWTCAVPGEDAAGYASAIAVDVGGVRQYVQFVAKGLVGVDAKTGKFLWRYDKTADVAANIPTPVFHDDCVFTSTARNGSGLNRIKVSKDAASSEEVYYNTTKLNSTGGVVRVGDYIYGTNAGGELVCMEFKTGEVKWHAKSVGAASLCYADGMLYVRGQGGTGFGAEQPSRVALVEATPDGYKEKGRFEQPDHADRPAWPHPVVANGRLYLRDQKVLFCYDVKGEK